MSKTRDWRLERIKMEKCCDNCGLRNICTTQEGYSCNSYITERKQDHECKEDLNGLCYECYRDMLLDKQCLGCGHLKTKCVCSSFTEKMDKVECGAEGCEGNIKPLSREGLCEICQEDLDETRKQRGLK